MPNKKITDLQLRANVSADLNFPSDDTIQSYRVTGQQILDFIIANVTLHTTGDLKPTLKATADAGWVMANDGTIGNAASSATTRANADTLDLFSLLWNNISNTHAAVSSGRGASAAADFAANKTIALPKMLGRALGIAGAGSSLTSRALGEIFGAETHALTANENGTHTHVQNAHNHAERNGQSFAVIGGAGTALSWNGTGTATNYSNTLTGDATASNQNSGLGSAHNNMQPTSFINVMIKL